MSFYEHERPEPRLARELQWTAKTANCPIDRLEAMITLRLLIDTARTAEQKERILAMASELLKIWIEEERI